MIKINNFIFNENEILYIKEDNKKLMVFLKQYVDKKVYDFIDGTFDDIEWNYDSTNDTCGELQQRINKTISYINSKRYLFTQSSQIELLNILIGEENESN